MPALERILRRSDARDSERAGSAARVQRRGARDVGPLNGNQALRRLIEKKKRKQERKQQDQPETPHEIALSMQEHLDNDPGDTSGRMRSQLEALQPEERQQVVTSLQQDASTTQKDRLSEVLSEPAPKSVDAPVGKDPEAQSQAEEAGKDQEPEQDEVEEKTAEPPAPPAEPEREAPERQEERARTEEEKRKKQEPAIREAVAGKEKTAGALEESGRTAEPRPDDTPESAIAKAAKAPAETKPGQPKTTPSETLKPSPGAVGGEAGGAIAGGKAEESPAPTAEESAATPSAEAPVAAQPQEVKAVRSMPAEVGAGAGAGAAVAPGPAAAKAAAQPAPATGGAPAAEAAGGGGGEGEATLEAEEDQGPAAEENDKAAAKMDEAQPADETEQEEKPEADEPPAPAAGTGEAPTADEQEGAKASDEEDRQAAAAGGPDHIAASEEDAEGDQAEAPAATAEVSGPEKDAGLASLAEGGGGGGEPGGGGGGGGGAVSEEPQPEAPDVSNAAPAAAMSSVAGLKVGAIASALGSVSSAIGKTVGDEKQELAASPPSMERPSGSPVTRDGPISEQYPAEEGAADTASVEPVAEGEAVELPEPEPVPEAGPDPTEAVSAPDVSGGENGELTEADAANMQGAVREMPTSDPGLETSAGPAPTLELQGDADPQQARDQRAELDTAVADQQSQGAEDLAKPMGEDEVYPTVPEETLEGKVPEGGGGSESGAGAAGVDDETAGIVAEEKEGESVRSSVQQAGADMAARQQEHVEEQAETRSGADEEIAGTVAENTSLQAEERAAAKRKVSDQRGQWSEGQRDAVDQAQTAADSEGQKLDQGVASQQTEANTKAQQEVDAGTEKAEAERRSGESKADSEKKKAESESDGVFGWLASKATAFFSALKKAVSAVISAMRKAVKAAIEFAKKAAFAVIDLYRSAIVGLIKLAGEALMAIGDVLLAAFPGLRAKFRKLIQEAVAAAEDAVNRLADGLKKAVAAALDALGAALDAILAAYEKALHFLLDAANKVVQGAIKAAQAAIAALAAFAAIIKDVAANPGQWISNLGAAVLDGIKNHLWKAFKTAIKNWFDQKLSEVLGVGMMIFQVLMKGGIKLAEVGKMAFEGLKAAIPAALIGILIEKLVAMIVPAAGAVMVIIEGLQAAWGTVSRIIAAISSFIAFLKAVKSGSAGAQFANMVAAAAVVVIDFVANWLIKRIRGPASKIGGKVKAIAKKILEKLKKVFKKITKAIKKVIAKVKKAVKKFFKKKKKPKSKNKEKRDQENAQKRLDKALQALRPKVPGLVKGGVARFAAKAKLLYYKVRYRLSSIDFVPAGDGMVVRARANPEGDAGKVFRPGADDLRRWTHDVVEEMLARGDVGQVANWMNPQQSGEMAGTKTSPTELYPGVGYPGRVRQHQEGMGRQLGPGQTQHYAMGETADQRVYEQLSPYGNTAHPLVKGVGTYPEINAELAGISGRTGLSQAELANITKNFVKTGALPETLGADGQKTIASLSVLMFGREAMRNPASLAHATMTMDLVGSGKMSMDDAFTKFEGSSKKGGGEFPMSMKGAESAAGELAEERAAAKSGQAVDPSKRSENAKELARREAALTEKWLLAEFKVKDLLFASQAEAESQIKDKVRQRLQKAFNLPKTPILGRRR